MSSETPIRQRLLIFLSICYFVLPEISNAQSEWTESECIAAGTVIAPAVLENVPVVSL